MKILGIVILAVIALGAGFWGGQSFTNRRATEQSAQVAEQHAAELLALRGQATSWANALSESQGEAVLRAFVSGIAPALRSERRESLELSALSLLRVPGVAGIHVLRPDGEVVYSSDAKLTTTGEAGDAGAWALAAHDLTSRAGAKPGTEDLALPLIDSGQVLAVVWMEFAQDKVRKAARPAALGSREASPDETPAETPAAEAQPNDQPAGGTMPPAATEPGT